MKKGFLAIVIFTILIFSSNTVWANFVDTYGLSASSIAQGNAVCSSIDNWAAVYYNMAGLGRTKKSGLKARSMSNKGLNNLMQNNQSTSTEEEGYRDEFALNYLATIPQITTKGLPAERQAAFDQNYLNFGAVNIGLVLDLNRFYKMPSVISSARFGLSAAVLHDFTSLNISVIKLNSVDPRAHNFMRYGCNAQRIVIHSGLGLGFMDDMFGFGIGMTALAGGKGIIDMSQVKLQNGVQYPVTQTYLNVTAAPGIEAGAYWDPGKIWDVVAGLSVGVYYRGSVVMDMPMSAGATMVVGGIALPMAITMLEYWTPHTFGGGVSYNFSNIIPITIPYMNNIKASLDFEYQLWSLYEMSKANKLNFVEANGLPEPKFADVYMPKFGLSVDILDWLGAMAGYSYQSSMVPDKLAKSIYNYMDNAKHTVSMGALFTVPKLYDMVTPIKITLAGQLQILSSRTVIKEADYANASNPDYSYGGLVPSFTLEVNMKW